MAQEVCVTPKVGVGHCLNSCACIDVDSVRHIHSFRKMNMCFYFFNINRFVVQHSQSTVVCIVCFCFCALIKYYIHCPALLMMLMMLMMLLLLLLLLLLFQGWDGFGSALYNLLSEEGDATDAEAAGVWLTCEVSGHEYACKCLSNPNRATNSGKFLGPLDP